MLDPENVDLADLALALEDHSGEHTWWLDPASGAVEPRFAQPLQDGSSAEVALETIELFGRHVLPKFDTEAEHRTSRFRDAAAVGTTA